MASTAEGNGPEALLHAKLAVCAFGTHGQLGAQRRVLGDLPPPPPNGEVKCFGHGTLVASIDQTQKQISNIIPVYIYETYTFSICEIHSLGKMDGSKKVTF